MKFKHWVQFKLFHDTTWHGQFKALRPLLLGPSGVEPVVVDVGANDGLYSSNSYPFIKRGWRAILVEPDPSTFAKASRLHAGNRQVTALNLACSDEPGTLPLILSGEGDGGSHSALDPTGGHARAGSTETNSVMVKVELLETILDQQKVPLHFGLLSVDTEGHDHKVIRGLNLSRFRPRVIITEKYENDAINLDQLRQHGYQLQHSLEYDTIWTDGNLT